MELSPWVAWFIVTRFAYLPNLHPLCRQTYLLCHLPPAFSAKSYYISNPKFLNAKERKLSWAWRGFLGGDPPTRSQRIDQDLWVTAGQRGGLRAQGNIPHTC